MGFGILAEVRKGATVSERRPDELGADESVRSTVETVGRDKLVAVDFYVRR